MSPTDSGEMRTLLLRFADRQAAEAEDIGVRSGAAIHAPSTSVDPALEMILVDLVGPTPAAEDVEERTHSTPVGPKLPSVPPDRPTRGLTNLHDAVLEEIREQLDAIKVPGAADAQSSSTWTELDVDSLDLLELVKALEDRFGITIDDNDLVSIESVGDAIELVVLLVEDTENDRTLT